MTRYGAFGVLNPDQETAMSIFGTIMDKIFHHDGNAEMPARSSPAGTAADTARPAAQAGTTSAPAAQAVDVEAVLSQMASQKGGGGNWRTSIVDLLKLLELDSS